MPEPNRDKDWKPAKRDKPGVKIQTGYRNERYAANWDKVNWPSKKKGAKNGRHT